MQWYIVMYGIVLLIAENLEIIGYINIVTLPPFYPFTPSTRAQTP
jgi:hypothetical protein